MNRINRPRPTANPTTPDAGAALMDMEQAISSLATTRPTFYRWLRAGRIKGVKIGRQWRFRRDDIDRFLRGESPRIDVPSDIKPLLQTLQERLGERASPPSGDLVLRACDLAIRLAIRLKASDLHLLPLPGSGSLQLRVDGALLEIARFDVKLHTVLADRFKGFGAMDTGIRDRAQDGRVTLKIDQQRMDLMITALPSLHGECVVACLHDLTLSLPTLEALPLSSRDRALIQRMVAAPSGLLVFTGPTGSGKSTSMCACARIAAAADTRLVTIERSLPFDLPQAVRVRVDAANGMGYAACLRAVLRVDPDIIVVEELRERESLEAATECSMTGHLLMSCYHAPDAISALRQIGELAHGSDAVLDELSLIVAQRFVRCLCPHCAVATTLSAADQRRAELVLGKGGSAKAKTKRAPGCTACRSTGFQGRMMIFEALEVTRELRSAVRQSATDPELRAIAARQGFTSMTADGARKALDGLTTLDEVWRFAPLPERPA